MHVHGLAITNQSTHLIVYSVLSIIRTETGEPAKYGARVRHAVCDPVSYSCDVTKEALESSRLKLTKMKMLKF